MTTLTEKLHAGGFLISEADGKLSRDNVTLVSGQNLVAGTVLGKISASGKYAAYDDQASDGTQTAVAILYEASDASGGDLVVCAITRSAEVNGNELTWPTGSPADITAGVADLAGTPQIIVRS
jgi:Bacteriophage lambda head decoration protein D